MEQTRPGSPVPEITTTKITVYPDPRSEITMTPIAQTAATATQINKQVYVDPAGWYSVSVPGEWQDMDQQNAFFGSDGFFETGYLPEMMVIQNVVDVCQWIANIDTQNTYSVSLADLPSSCKLTPLQEINYPVKQAIIENPSADWTQRFLYIKTDTDHFAEIMDTFTWLKPVDVIAKPEYRTAPSRSTDTTYLENTTTLPAEISIAEYPLPEEVQNGNPSEIVFSHHLPPGTALEELQPGTAWVPDTWKDVNRVISPFGYALQSTSQVDIYELYQDGVLIFDHIDGLPKVYHFETSAGEMITFIVRTLRDPELSRYAPGNATRYLIQNESITKWEEGSGSPIAPDQAPILVKDELLWLDIDENTYLHVINNQRHRLFSFATFFGANLPVRQFTAWEDHWVVEVGDFIIIDGEILNEKMDYDGAFDWHLLNDKPFYFFRKGAQVGISYDGQILPASYHEIAHGHCCGLALNNPILDENAIRFFGKRDGIWYSVVVETS